MLKPFSLLFLVFLSLGSLSQRDSYISVEALGSGGLGGIYYEADFSTGGIFDAQYRVGFSFTPIDANNGTVLIFPHMIHGILGQGISRVDFGLGFAPSITTRGQFFVRNPLSLGYRFEPPKKNFYIRASYTPILSLIVDDQWQHWGGLTFGFKLTNRNAD